MDFNKLYIKIMYNVSAFMWYFNEYNRHNISIHMQGFPNPTLTWRKIQDGHKRTLSAQILQWEQQKLFSRHFQDSKYVGEKNTFFGGWWSDFSTKLILLFDLLIVLASMFFLVSLCLLPIYIHELLLPCAHMPM